MPSTSTVAAASEFAVAEPFDEGNASTSEAVEVQAVPIAYSVEHLQERLQQKGLGRQTQTQTQAPMSSQGASAHGTNRNNMAAHNSSKMLANESGMSRSVPSPVTATGQNFVPNHHKASHASGAGTNHGSMASAPASARQSTSAYMTLSQAPSDSRQKFRANPSIAEYLSNPTYPHGTAAQHAGAALQPPDGADTALVKGSHNAHVPPQGAHKQPAAALPCDSQAPANKRPKLSSEAGQMGSNESESPVGSKNTNNGNKGRRASGMSDVDPVDVDAMDADSPPSSRGRDLEGNRTGSEAAAAAAAAAEEEGWLTTGSKYIGMRGTRFAEESGQKKQKKLPCTFIITQWLPKDVHDPFLDDDGQVPRLPTSATCVTLVRTT